MNSNEEDAAPAVPEGELYLQHGGRGSRGGHLRQTMLRLHMDMVHVQLPAEVQPRPNTERIQKHKLMLVDGRSVKRIGNTNTYIGNT